MTRRIRTAAALAALVVAVSGCQTPGTAAVVNGERISDRDVSAVISDLGANPALPAIAPADVVPYLAYEKLLSQLAEDFNFTLSDEQVTTAFNQAMEANGAPTLDPATTDPATVDFLRTQSYIDTVTTLPNAEEVQAAFGPMVEAAEIEINPRYGIEFDPETTQFAPITPEWIASSN